MLLNRRPAPLLKTSLWGGLCLFFLGLLFLRHRVPDPSLRLPAPSRHARSSPAGNEAARAPLTSAHPPSGKQAGEAHDLSALARRHVLRSQTPLAPPSAGSGPTPSPREPEPLQTLSRTAGVLFLEVTDDSISVKELYEQPHPFKHTKAIRGGGEPFLYRIWGRSENPLYEGGFTVGGLAKPGEKECQEGCLRTAVRRDQVIYIPMLPGAERIEFYRLGNAERRVGEWRVADAKR